MQILELIQKTTSFLEKRRVDEPRLQIELMLAHVLKLKRLQLYLQFERTLSEAELAPLREMVRRRGEHEPLQYILGTTEFYGLEFAVDRRALIPRRETEHLVEAVLKSFPDPQAGMDAIDLGTGSGILATTLAVQLAASRWVATDASSDALALAGENARRHGVEGRIRQHQGSWWAAVPPEDRFDLIVSNPPYIRTGDLDGLAPELRQFEPVQALDGGGDGLDAYRAILSDAASRVRPGGRLAMEIGWDQAGEVGGLLEAHGWCCDPPLRDLQGHDRVLTAKRA